MLILSDNNLTVESSSRRVSAGEASTVEELQQILDTAHAQAEAIRASAQEEVAQARAQGYQQGLDDGQAEIIQQKIKMVERSVSYLAQLEGRVVDVVMAVLNKCMGEIDCQQVIVGIIDRAMASVVRTQRQMTIRVAPGNLEVVRQHIVALRERYPSVTTLQAAADESLSDTDCVLDTDAGTVDASLKVQLAAIERAFRQCFNR